MATEGMKADIRDRGIILSTLWTFVMFNYLYADLILVIFNPGIYAAIAAGMSEVFVLGAAALIEIPIAMVVLSRVLKRRTNRWANVLAGAESTAFVCLTAVGGTMPAHYLFFAAIEIATTAFITWYAWTWKGREDSRADPRPDPARPGESS